MPAWALAIALASCGAEGPTPPSSMQIETGAPASEGAPSDAEPTELPADAPVVALGAAKGGVWIGTEAGLRVVSGDEVRPVEATVDGEPSPVGAVQAMARRGDELLVASSEGLFQTSGASLRPSPASEILAGLRVFAMDHVGGAADEVWIAAQDGLYRVHGGEVTRWKLDLEGDVPTALRAAGEFVFVAYGERLFEIHVEAQRADEVALGLGRIHAIERGEGGVAYLATDEGLCVRDAGGAYTLYTLGEGEARQPVHALASMPGAGVYASVPTGVVALRHGQRPVGLAAFDAGAPATSMAADDAGRVWIASGSTVRGLQLGLPSSFEKDVRPIFEKHCVSCHDAGSQAPRIDFRALETVRQRSDRIAARIAGGEMPPAPNAPVSPEEYEVFARWNRTGQQP